LIVEFARDRQHAGGNDRAGASPARSGPFNRREVRPCQRSRAFPGGATLEWQGRKYYFIGEETRQEFARQNEIAVG
jgi:hypothetical protein